MLACAKCKVPYSRSSCPLSTQEFECLQLHIPRQDVHVCALRALVISYYMYVFTRYNVVVLYTGQCCV